MRTQKPLTAGDVISLLGLEPLPVEGGYYRETQRSDLLLPANALPDHYDGARAASTTIYYLLTETTCSAMHRLNTDEIFHFYLGDPVEQLQLLSEGQHRVVTIGTDLVAGQRPQVSVAAGVWQGALLSPGGRWALLGTTMAPGFELADFELGDRRSLCQAYPDATGYIHRLTH